MNLKTSHLFLARNALHAKKLALTLGCSALFLAATPLIAADKVIAVVNGHNVTESQLKIAATQSKLDYQNISPEQRKLLTEALVNRELVLGEAINAKFDQDPEVAARVKALIDSYIAANYLATVAEKYTSSEAEIKAYYDKNISSNTPKEFKARHILVKTEDEAKALIKEIKGGADFSKLAKEKSIDTGSAAKGGDMGWFKEHDMLDALAKAFVGLKKGELAKAPVKSQFGWHVIILDDQRSAPAPKFADVKSNIDKLLIKIKLNDYLKELNSKASIEVK